MARERGKGTLSCRVGRAFVVSDRRPPLDVCPDGCPRPDSCPMTGSCPMMDSCPMTDPCPHSRSRHVHGRASSLQGRSGWHAVGTRLTRRWRFVCCPSDLLQGCTCAAAAEARGEASKDRSTDLTQLRSTLKVVRRFFDTYATPGDDYEATCKRFTAAYVKAIEQVHPDVSVRGSFSEWSVRTARNNIDCKLAQPALPLVPAPTSKRKCSKFHQAFLVNLGGDHGGFGRCACHKCVKSASA